MKKNLLVRGWQRARQMPGYNRFVYEMISVLYGKRRMWRLMNYGYAPLTDDTPLVLDPADEPDRYALQLYYFVASAGALQGKDVLEVGSGRGGGAVFLHGTSNRSQPLAWTFPGAQSPVASGHIQCRV